MILAKEKRGHNKKYLVWIRTQPSILQLETWHDQAEESEPHHFTAPGRGGMGTKCPDERAVPLTFGQHREIHQVGRSTFLKRNGLTTDDIEAHIKRLNKLWEEKCANSK